MRITPIASLAFVSAITLVPAFAVTPKVEASKVEPASTTTTPPVSTGVSAPSILNLDSIQLPPGSLARTIGGEATVVLALTVDRTGNPYNVHVVQSAGEGIDSRVVAGVQQAHFRPGRLNNEAIPMAMSLVVRVER